MNDPILYHILNLASYGRWSRFFRGYPNPPKTSGSRYGLKLKPLGKFSVIRQKGQSQNGCFKKTKRQIFRKTNMPYSLIHKRTSVHFKLPSYHEHLPETLFTTGTCYHFNNLNGEMQCSWKSILVYEKNIFHKIKTVKIFVCISDNVIHLLCLSGADLRSIHFIDMTSLFPSFTKH